jgi:hypothetical protein
MKRINKKPGQSVPEGFNGIFEGESVGPDVTLRTEMPAIFFPILFYNTCINTIRTKTVVTLGAIPLCWSGGMVFADRFHGHGKTPSFQLGRK